MSMILKLEGHEVQIAYDGEAALVAVRSFQPEAILTDIGLPGIDGLERARRILRVPELSAGVALFAAVTGYAEPESRRLSQDAGFDRHLANPVDPEAVLALLASLEWRPSLVLESLSPSSLSCNRSPVEGDMCIERHRAARIPLRCVGRSDEWHYIVADRFW
jgi:CheY-like chemotaxis protein